MKSALVSPGNQLQGEGRTWSRIDHVFLHLKEIIMKFLRICLIFTLFNTVSFGAERSPSMDVAISGHSDDFAVEVIGNYSVSERWDLNLGLGSTSLSKAEVYDVKFGLTAVKEKYFETTASVGFFVGQTQIKTRDDLVLDRQDQKFFFMESRMGIGPIGVGYRFNFMHDHEGLLLGTTRIKTATVYPYMSVRFDF
jgi:hypothetical protein